MNLPHIFTKYINWNQITKEWEIEYIKRVINCNHRGLCVITTAVNCMVNY